MVETKKPIAKKPVVKAPVKKVVKKVEVVIEKKVEAVEKTMIGGRKIISVVKETPFVTVTDDLKTVYKLHEKEYQSL